MENMTEAFDLRGKPNFFKEEIINHVFSKDLAFALRVLLSAKSTYKKVKRISRVQPTTIVRYKSIKNCLKLPPGQKHRSKKFATYIENISQLMYRIKESNLKMFMEDEANLTLLRFFSRNNGLALTNPKEDKPSCR